MFMVNAKMGMDPIYWTNPTLRTILMTNPTQIGSTQCYHQ